MDRIPWRDVEPWLAGLTFPCSTDQVVQWLKVHHAPEIVVRSVQSVPEISHGGPRSLEVAYESDVLPGQVAGDVSGEW